LISERIIRQKSDIWLLISITSHLVFAAEWPLVSYAGYWASGERKRGLASQCVRTHSRSGVRGGVHDGRHVHPAHSSAVSQQAVLEWVMRLCAV